MGTVTTSYWNAVLVVGVYGWLLFEKGNDRLSMGRLGLYTEAITRIRGAGNTGHKMLLLFCCFLTVGKLMYRFFFCMD